MASAIAMDAPLVSVVMSVYNGEAYLNEAVDSILNQTYENFEFIIIDDGSKDTTLKILKSYKDKRIVLNSRANKGLVNSLNEGIRLANGKFIARQDYDDISQPERLQKQIDYLRSHQQIGLVGTQIEVIDEENRRVSKKMANVDLLTSPDDLKLAEVFSNQFAHGSIMARAEVIKKFDFDGNFTNAEDYDLWTRMSHKVGVANLKEILYLWRMHEKGITATKSEAMREQAFKIRDREFQYFLLHRSEYILFSFHPFSMRGGVRFYLLRKNSLYLDMAMMYCRHGLRRRAVPIILLATLHAPWLKKNYRHLFLTVINRNSALTLDYELF